ncbi:MAG: hypothetical protein K2G47_05840 [Muribaculum sp.]|nr:hypothetical protein [Muribaculum sp.]
MDELIDRLKTLVADPSLTPDDEWVDAMYREAPYFPLPAMLQLQRDSSLSEERRRELIRRVALNSPDAEALYRLVEPMAADLEAIYPPQQEAATPTTDAAIETFIDNYGTADSKEEEILEKLIFNPVADYAQILAEEEERSVPDDSDAEGDSQDSLINAFILKSRDNNGHFPAANAEKSEPHEAPPVAAPEPINPPVVQDDSLLSESLAKIYIKQRRYDKAFEIISGLSLKYPEKSIYFADQLRFLQKLIINQKYIKQK